MNILHNRHTVTLIKVLYNSALPIFRQKFLTHISKLCQKFTNFFKRANVHDTFHSVFQIQVKVFS